MAIQPQCLSDVLDFQSLDSVLGCAERLEAIVEFGVEQLLQCGSIKQMQVGLCQVTEQPKLVPSLFDVLGKIVLPKINASYTQPVDDFIDLPGVATELQRQIAQYVVR